MALFKIDLDEFFDGVVGLIISVFGFIMLIVLGLTTNYVPVGVGLGLATAGFFTSIRLILKGLELLTSKEKSNKIWEIIILSIVVVLLIAGFVSPIYFDGLKIKFSRLVGMFASPFIPFSIMSIIINTVDEGIEEGIMQIIMKSMALLAYVAIGILFTGIVYFTGMNKVLNVLDKNFTYEDREQIYRRDSHYNSQDFEVIFTKMIEETKEKAEKNNKSFLDCESEYVKRHKKLSPGYQVESFQLVSGEHTYLLVIEDQARYDSNYKYPKYYPVVDFEKLEIVEFRKNSAGIEDDGVTKELEKIENMTNVSTDSYMKYALTKMKESGAEINCQNISNEGKYLKMGKKISCGNLRQLDDGCIQITLTVDKGITRAPSQDTYVIRSDYSYETLSIYEIMKSEENN